MIHKQNYNKRALLLITLFAALFTASFSMSGCCGGRSESTEDVAQALLNDQHIIYSVYYDEDLDQTTTVGFDENNKVIVNSVSGLYQLVVESDVGNGPKEKPIQKVVGLKAGNLYEILKQVGVQLPIVSYNAFGDAAAGHIYRMPHSYLERSDFQKLAYTIPNLGLTQAVTNEELARLFAIIFDGKASGLIPRGGFGESNPAVTTLFDGTENQGPAPTFGPQSLSGVEASASGSSSTSKGTDESKPPHEELNNSVLKEYYKKPYYHCGTARGYCDWIAYDFKGFDECMSKVEELLASGAQTEESLCELTKETFCEACRKREGLGLDNQVWCRNYGYHFCD